MTCSRRRFLALAGSAGLGLLGSACGALRGRIASTPAPTPPSPTPSAELPSPALGQKVVAYWHNLEPGPGADAHNRQIRSFLDANQGYAVRSTYVANGPGGQLAEKLVAAIATGEPPDAGRWDRFAVSSWAARGYLTGLTAQARRDKVTAERFLREAWLEATYDGKLYAVPFDTDLRGLYYNKRHFREAGLDPERPPRTIDELGQMGETLTKKSGDGYARIGFLPWLGQGSLYTWAWVFGGELYDRARDEITLDAPLVVKALDWMVGYTGKYGVGPIDRLESLTGPNERDPLVGGLVSMIADGDWMVGEYLKYMPSDQREDWDVAPLPKAAGGPDQVTWGGGWSTIVPKGAREQDGGWLLAKHLGVEAAGLWAIQTTRLPVYLAAYDELEKSRARFDVRWPKFWPLRSVARFRPNLPVGQELWTAQGTAVDEARHLRADPVGILGRLNADLRTRYARYKR